MGEWVSGKGPLPIHLLTYSPTMGFSLMPKRLKESAHIVSSDTEVGVNPDCAYRVWPLRNEADYYQTMEIVDKLAAKGEEQLTPLERDRLEVISVLIEKYEDEHHDIKPLEMSPIDFLKLLMRESGMSAPELGKLLGDRALGYRVLKGEKNLSKSHIKILSDYFKVDASSFI